MLLVLNRNQNMIKDAAKHVLEFDRTHLGAKTVRFVWSEYEVQ